MNHQQRENCRKLAELLDRVKPKTFDMQTWLRVSPHSCGTTACAFGWAMISGEFEGLRYGLKTWDEKGEVWLTDLKDKRAPDAAETPIVDGYVSGIQSAAVRYFGKRVYDEIFINRLLLQTSPAHVANMLRDAAGYW